MSSAVYHECDRYLSQSQEGVVVTCLFLCVCVTAEVRKLQRVEPNGSCERALAADGCECVVASCSTFTFLWMVSLEMPVWYSLGVTLQI